MASGKRSLADQALLETLHEDVAAILQKSPDEATANDLVVLDLARQHAEIAAENRDLKDRIVQLEQEKKTDPLTHLENRHALEERLAQDQAPDHPVAHEKRQTDKNTTSAVLLIDLDGFKQINDNYGHDAGDRALQAVADTLRHTLRSEDNATIRLGGDEFIVLLHNINPDDVERVARRVYDAITSTRFILTRDDATMEETVGASIGVKVHREGGSLRTDIEEADAAMYAAKTKKGTGEPTIVIAPDFMQEVAEAQAEERADGEADPA